MCRRQWIWGYALIAFGIGVLVGTWMNGGFWPHCLGFALVIFGLSADEYTAIANSIRSDMHAVAV